MIRQIIFLIGALIIISAQGCRSVPELSSTWLHEGISIDADDSEWRGGIEYFDKQSVAVGMKNDSTDLYLLLKTTDRQLKDAVMQNGFIVWFSADGKKKDFGVRYPIGVLQFERGRPHDPSEWRTYGYEGRLEMIRKEMLTKVEIMESSEIVQNRFSTANAHGISVALADTNDTLIYELRVPLSADNNRYYHIGAEPGTVINVGFETARAGGRFLMSEDGQEGVRGGGGGGGGGRMAVGGGGMRTRGGPGGMRDGKQIDFWVKLHLAAESGLHEGTR